MELGSVHFNMLHSFCGNALFPQCISEVPRHCGAQYDRYHPYMVESPRVEMQWGTIVRVYRLCQCKLDGSLIILIVAVMVYIYRIDWGGVVMWLTRVIIAFLLTIINKKSRIHSPIGCLLFRYVRFMQCKPEVPLVA